jgi:hypothetical protein
MGSNSLGKLDSLKQMGPISSRNFLRSLGPICPEQVGRKGLATLLRKGDLTKFPQLPWEKGKFCRVFSLLLSGKFA